ncbi:MAG TPA: glycosyltransferase family 2 protein [Clostridia bacterium]|nr:glycosyltransferase family 2 protein [Clostridia bacterium]
MILFWVEFLVLVSGFAAGVVLFWQIPRLPCTKADPSIRVSVVIPARNEANTLPLLLADLSAQTRTPYEIIVVNDNSEDETEQIALAYGVKVISLTDKPVDWVGKCWACQQGAEAATGDSLLFLDADVRLAPGAFSRILAAHETFGTISVQPYHEPKRAVEDLALFFNLAQICANGSALPRPINLGLFGPLIAISRQDYFAFHGHEPVKSVVLEDMALADCLRSKQISFRLFVGDEDVRFRMYSEGFPALWHGFTKNFATAAAKLPAWLMILMILFIASLASVPLHLALSLAAASPLSWLYGSCYAIWLISLFLISRRVGKFRPLTVLLYPVPLLVFLVVFLNSCWIRLIHGNVKWKGRAIKLDR